MGKNVHTGNLRLSFFPLSTTLQLNGLFWAASWALCAPHKGEEDTARHSQRAFRLATQSLSTRLTAVILARQR